MMEESTLPKTGNALEDAKELGRGVMRGFKPDFKLGWPWEGALAAAVRKYRLTDEERLHLAVYLRGFAHGIADYEDQLDIPAIYANGITEGGEEKQQNSDAYPAQQRGGRR
jgi:hypothetical protein